MKRASLGGPGLVIRRFAGSADFGRMNEIENDNRIANGNDFIMPLEAFTNVYEHLSNCDPSHDILIAESGGAMVGFARGNWRLDTAGVRILELACFVDPGWLRRGVGGRLLEAIEARMREVDASLAPAPARYFQAEASDLADGHRALLLQAGYEPSRSWSTMIRPTLEDQTDAPIPVGLEVREVAPTQLRAIWEAHQEAFLDHWGWRPQTESDFLQYLNDPLESDTSLWRIAWDGDQVAGQVRSFINPLLNERLGIQRGWVEAISVRRPWRGLGLARALIVASFSLLRARGMTEGALTVDTKNVTGAVRVYESCGFVAVKQETIYRKPLTSSALSGTA